MEKSEAPSYIVEHGVFGVNSLGKFLSRNESDDVEMTSKGSCPSSLPSFGSTIQYERSDPTTCLVSIHLCKDGWGPRARGGRGGVARGPPGGMRERQGSRLREAPRRSKSPA